MREIALAQDFRNGLGRIPPAQRVRVYACSTEAWRPPSCAPLATPNQRASSFQQQGQFSPAYSGSSSSCINSCNMTKDIDAQQDILGVVVGQTAARKNLTYAEIVDAISSIDKTEILLKASSALWHIWKHETPPPGREEDYELCRAYLGRIAAIAAGRCGSGSQLGNFGEAELIQLAGEFLGVTDAITDTVFFNQEEVPRFRDAIQNHDAFKNKIPSQDVLRGYAARLVFIRTLRSQWDFRSVSMNGVLRSWDIVGRLNSDHGGQVFERLKRTLNIELKDYVRAGFAILAVANNKTPGVISGQELLIDSDVARVLNLDKDALLLVANRLSRSCVEFSEWHCDVMKSIPEPYRKYAPHPLVSSPLIRLDQTFRGWIDGEKGYLCPSPPHLLWKVQSSCVDAIRDLAPTGGQNLMADLGECLSDYLCDFLSLVCGKENVVRLDDVSDNSKKHADFVVVVGELALVIESKTSLGSTLAKSIATPEDIVDVWARLHSAYRQCAHTINSDVWEKHSQLGKAKRFVSIVCFDEVFCPDGAAFNSFAVSCGIWGELGIGPVEAISLQDFEQFMSQLGPGQLGYIIQAKWYYKRHGDMLRSFIRSQNVELAVPSMEHLRAAAADLFPGFNMLTGPL